MTRAHWAAGDLHTCGLSVGGQWRGEGRGSAGRAASATDDTDGDRNRVLARHRTTERWHAGIFPWPCRPQDRAAVPDLLSPCPRFLSESSDNRVGSTAYLVPSVDGARIQRWMIWPSSAPAGSEIINSTPSRSKNDCAAAGTKGSATGVKPASSYTKLFEANRPWAESRAYAFSEAPARGSKPPGRVVHRQNSIRGQCTGGEVGRAYEVGSYRCARAVWTGLSLRGATFGDTPWTDLDHGLSLQTVSLLSCAALVVVVQTTDFWDLDDVAHAGRVNGSRLRSVFAEGEMGSRFVIVGKMGGQDSTEMLFAKDDHVIETLSAYGSHKALSVGILPGRPRCCEHLVDAEATNSTSELASVDAIAITDHVLGRTVFGKCLHDLLCRPSRAGMLGDVEVKKAASVVGQYEEDVEHAKGRGGHGEEVDRGQRPDVVVEKGSPRLRGRFACSRRHQARDLSLGDHDPEFEKLAVNSRCAPALVGCSHALDQVTHLATEGRSTKPSVPRTPRPESAEGPSVPAHNCIGLHDDQDLPPAGPELGEGDPEEPTRMGQARAWVSMLEDRELLSQSKVLEDEIASAAESRPKGAEETEEDGSHHMMMLQVGS